MDEISPPDLGPKLRALRKRRGLSLRTLAALCGLSANTISLVERGKTSPSVATLHRLAVIGVQVHRCSHGPVLDPEALQILSGR
jgi:transcriptional regulator with XRE-family HTH domain